MTSYSPIIELRQYTLRPNQRDVLIELFEAKFIESQEQAGMKIIGQFRDLDDADLFVWLRGFGDFDQRAQSLSGFYGGPIWRENRDTANDTMVDSDNVLMMRPARQNSTFALTGARPPIGSDGEPDGAVEITVSYQEPDGDEDSLITYFEDVVVPAIGSAGGTVLGYFVSDTRENNYPILPIRNERVLMTAAGYLSRTSYESGSSAIETARKRAAEAPGLEREPEVHRLVPTIRSLLHGLTQPCEAVTVESGSRHA